MSEILSSPFAGRFEPTPGMACGESFCDFELPCCKGCPKSNSGQARGLEDPMKSVIWLGWINGIAGIEK